MRDFFVLYMGETTRMRKYGVSTASLGVAFLWVLVLHFAGAGKNIDSVFPLVLFIDSTMMSLLLIGVIMIFEKQENATKSMLVIPAGKDHYLLSKTLAVMTSSFVTLVLLLTYGLAVRHLSINILGLAGAVLLVSFTFAQLGVLLTYRSKDFTDLLMGMMKYTIVLAIPTILEFLKVLKADWVKTIQYVNPTKSALILLLAPAVKTDAKDLWISIIYMIVLGCVSYWLVRRMFYDYAVKEIGG